MVLEGTDSPADSSVDAPDTGTTPDTVQVPDERTPDVDALLADLEKVADRIPPEKVRFLDKHFQPAFNRKLNLLRDNVNTSAGAAFRDTGVELPADKTAFDLITENDGKGFVDVIRKVVSKEFEPVREKISQAEQQQILGSAIMRAQADNPEVKQYLAAAVPIIDGDADLTQMAMLGNGQGIYYVLQGVASQLALRDRDVKIRELSKLLEANKIATKTAGGTTRAGSGAPKETPVGPAKTLKDAAKQALETYKQKLAEG